MIKGKLKQMLKSSRGFTMIEMIITVMITAIFFSSVVMILPTITKSYNKVISLNYARQITTSVAEAVTEQLSYATSVTIEKTSIKYVYFDSYDNQVKQREIGLGENGVIPGLIYDTNQDQNYYMDKTVELQAVKSKENICTLQITVYEKGTSNVLIEKTRMIRLYGI